MSIPVLNALDPDAHRFAALAPLEAAEGPLQDEERGAVAMFVQSMMEAGELEPAIEGFRRVHALHARRDGDSHPDSVRLGVTLTELLLLADQSDEARSTAERLLKLPGLDEDARFGLMHLRTRAMAGDENPAPRREALLQLIREAEEAGGPDSVFKLVAHCNLAEVDFSIGEPASARDHWEIAAAGYTRVHGADHDETLEVRTNLAVARKVLGDWAGALPEEEYIHALRTARLGPEAPLTLGAGHNLGLTLLMVGQHDRGEALLEQVFAGKLEHMGPHDQETTMTGRALAEHYENTGRPERAHELRGRHRAALRQMFEQMGIDPAMLDRMEQGGEE